MIRYLVAGVLCFALGYAGGVLFAVIMEARYDAQSAAMHRAARRVAWRG